MLILIIALGQGIKCVFIGNQWLRLTHLEIALKLYPQQNVREYEKHPTGCTFFITYLENLSGSQQNEI